MRRKNGSWEMDDCKYYNSLGNKVKEGPYLLRIVGRYVRSNKLQSFICIQFFNLFGSHRKAF